MLYFALEAWVGEEGEWSVEGVPACEGERERPIRAHGDRSQLPALSGKTLRFIF